MEIRVGGESKAGGMHMSYPFFGWLSWKLWSMHNIAFSFFFFFPFWVMQNFPIVKKPGVPMIAIWFWPMPVPPALVWSWGHKVVHEFEVKSQSSL